MKKIILKANTDADTAEKIAAESLTDKRIVKLLSDLLLIQLQGKDPKYRISIVNNETNVNV